MKNNKSNRRLAKELLKLVKNNNQYRPYDYWYQKNEYIKTVNENEVLGALCSGPTKKWLRELRHKETKIKILGICDISLYIVNDTLGVEIPLIHLGGLPNANTTTLI